MKRAIVFVSILVILVLVVGPVAVPVPVDGGYVQSAAGQAAPGVGAGDERFDYNIYLQRRVIRDPGLSRACLGDIRAADASKHVIVQLNSLPRLSPAPPTPPMPFKIYLPCVVRSGSLGNEAGSTKGADLVALEALGITLLSYLNGITAPGTAYFAAVSPAVNTEDETFRELVRGIVCIEPDDKIQLGLLAGAPGPEPIPVVVQFFKDVEREEARALLSHLGLDAEPYAPPNLWQTSATPAGIRALADNDIVQWVEFGPIPFLPTLDDVRAELNVDVVQALDTTTGIYAGLSGNGVQVGIMDSGVDDHHNDFAGRIIRSRHGGGDHGTHVAGIAAGSGAQSNQNDDDGNLNPGTAFQWRGMAPQAGIAAYGSAGGNAGNYDDAINNFGVDVTNHSYVLQVQGLYDAAVSSVDSIVRGDSPGIPARPVVWAAANNANQGPRDIDDDGIDDCVRPQYPRGCPDAYQVGYFSVLGPCKNCISVASANKNSLIHTGFSSMGPTMDGRLKPDIAAIGLGVVATGADTDSSGDPAPCDTTVPFPRYVCGNSYRSKSGTSMAAPAVTGIIGLLLEQYVQTFGVNLDTAPPLPSTVKAILIQTATDLAGTDTTVNADTGAVVTYGAGPDWATGYGLVDAQAAVQLVEERRFIEDQLSMADVTDEFILSVVPGQTEVRVTLAWDDLAGTPNSDAAAAQLVNDLDLTVVDPDGILHQPLVLPLLTPRDCDGDNTNGVQVGTCAGLDPAAQNYFGPAAEGVDRRNNVEQVVVQDLVGLTPGQWTVRVSVLEDDGVTVRLPLGGDQSYSLAGVTALRADLVISKGDTPDPVVAGEQLVYTIEVTNDGPDPATDVTVLDTLPPEVAYDSNTAPEDCSRPTPGTLLCGLGELEAGQSEDFEVTVQVPADVVYNAGGPATIANSAEVFSTNPDPDLTNNAVLEETLVVASADLEIVSFEAVDPPAEILVGQPVTVLLRKVITNHGPSAPMDVELTKTATAPPDSTVTPTDSTATELALGLDEQRVVDEVFTVECGAPSHHTFSFTNEIQPLHAEDSDPDPSNNTASLELDFECVVPVVINIKPGSDPNSINPNSMDVVPIAVLSTLAGEYGTPIDFDATTIDPLSVRFGPRDEVWAETGGAFEAHERGHIEDSLELDERTQDGDLDMVLHFHVQETGISAGHTEACARGHWIDAEGGVHTFFGCDAVRIPPGGAP